MNKRPKENELDVNDLLNLPSIHTLLDDKEEKAKPKAQTASQKEEMVDGALAMGGVKANEQGEEILPTQEGDMTDDTEPAKINGTDNATNLLSQSSIWKRFVANLSKYEIGYVGKPVSNYRIEKEILFALESLNHKNMNVTQLINCILRTFIEEHSKELKKMRRKRGRSILDSD